MMINRNSRNDTLILFYSILIMCQISLKNALANKDLSKRGASVDDDQTLTLPTNDDQQKQQQHGGGGQPFWIVVEVTNLRWRSACISTQLCNEPKFTLAQQMTKYNERMAQDWPLTKTIITDSFLQMFTFWNRGEPNGISIQAYVFGVDPKFKFPRVCDETPSVFVFPRNNRGANANANDYHKNTITTDGRMGSGPTTAIHLELHGLCFNATLSVQLFQKRCPWCEEPIIQADNSQNDEKNSPQSMQSRIMPFLQMRTHLLIFLLAIATAVNVFAFLGLLFICIRQCRTGKEAGSSRGSSFSTSHSPNPGASIENSPIPHSHSHLSGQQFHAKSGNGIVSFQHHYLVPTNSASTMDYSQEELTAAEVPRSSPLWAIQQQQRAEQFHRMFSTPECSPAQVLPSIQEEHYEVINDDYVKNEQPINDGKAMGTAMKTPTKKMIRLPQSNQCHHCFLRHQYHHSSSIGHSDGHNKYTGADVGDDRCSCASFAFDDVNEEGGQHLAAVGSSPLSPTSSSSFSSSSTSPPNDDGTFTGGKAASFVPMVDSGVDASQDSSNSN